MRLKRPCKVPGCPEVGHETYCSRHSRAREAQRGSAAVRGYDRQWRKVRIRTLRAAGWRCQRCRTRPADTSRLQVHHKDRNPTGPRRFHPDNLEVLCESCHAAEHGPRVTM